MQSLEKSESVEMLRYLENGYDVQMVHVDDVGLSVDSPKDIKLVEEYLNGNN
jgi:CMP-2-keto-3-deoxyoctulosonic acid synthetase